MSEQMFTVEFVTNEYTTNYGMYTEANLIEGVARAMANFKRADADMFPNDAIVIKRT